MSARAHAARRIARLDRAPQLGRDRAGGARRGDDVVAVLDDEADPCVFDELAGDGDRDRADADDLAALPRLGMPVEQRCAVDLELDLDRLALAGQGDERIGGVGLPRLAPPGPAGVGEDPREMALEGGVEAGTGIEREADVGAVGAVGIRPAPQPPPVVQAPRPGPVVGLGAGAHLAAPVAQALHARLTRRIEEVALGAGSAPAVSPVLAASQFSALRCRSSRHTLVSSTPRAADALIDAHSRSPRAARPGEEEEVPPS